MLHLDVLQNGGERDQNIYQIAQDVKGCKKKPWCKQSSPPEWWRGEPDNQQLLQVAPPELFLLIEIPFVILPTWNWIIW